MIEPFHKQLSIKTQCPLLSISRASWYYAPKGEPPLNLQLMRLIDEPFFATPIMAAARWRAGYGDNGITYVVIGYDG